VTSTNEKISILKDKINRQEIKIIKIINELENTTQTSSLYYAQKKVELNSLFRELNYIMTDFLKLELPKNYNKSMSDMIAKLKAYKTLSFKNLSYKELINKDSAKQGYTAIINEGITSYTFALSNGQKEINKLLYITQQINASEKAINKAIGESIEGDQINVNKTKKAIQNKLIEKSKDGKIITVIDKNGKPRNYDIKKYSELVARTKLRDVQTEASLNLANEVETDLIQVSSHNTSTPLCQEYEGKIFSLTGKNKDFPVIDLLTPFHPNCQHSIFPVIEEALKADGTYDKYVDFSNDVIEEHPTKPSFIPVSERAAQ
jgi:hypothetical protein